MSISKNNLTFFVLQITLFSQLWCGRHEDELFWLEQGIELGSYNAVSNAIANDQDVNQLMHYPEMDCWLRPLSLAIISMNNATDENSISERLNIIQLLIDSGARINNQALKCIDKIELVPIWFVVHGLLTAKLSGVMQGEDLQLAIMTDQHQILSFLIKNNVAITIEDLKCYLATAKNHQSKKLGRLLLSRLRITEGLGAGTSCFGVISKVGIKMWNQGDLSQVIPYELINRIATMVYNVG